MFINAHLNEVVSNLSIYESDEFLQICKVLSDTHQAGNWVFVGGNGGSQSMLEHFAADWNKGIREITGKPLKTFVLNSSLPNLTAIANDFAYEETLSYPLEGMASGNDILLLVSSSGKSPNILRAIEVANQKAMTTILISGFGKKSQPAKASIELNISSSDYQVIEDVHNVFGHLILKFFSECVSK